MPAPAIIEVGSEATWTSGTSHTCPTPASATGRRSVLLVFRQRYQAEHGVSLRVPTGPTGPTG